MVKKPEAGCIFIEYSTGINYKVRLISSDSNFKTKRKLKNHDMANLWTLGVQISSETT
jgi:hypothetical protein